MHIRHASFHSMQGARETRRSRVSAGLVGWALVPLLAFALAQEELQAAELLRKSDLVYEGAFRVPSGTFGDSTFASAGSAPAYNPNNNSLFMASSDQTVAEVSIPAIRNSNDLNDLATATVLQGFTEITEGKIDTVSSDSAGNNIGGLMVYKGKLYGTAYSYYDADRATILSHFVSSLNLSLQGDAKGMYEVGDVGAGYVAGHMAPIPPEWQASLGGNAITGQGMIPITGRTSPGPAAFSFDPEDLGQKDPVPASPLVYYTLSNPLAPLKEQSELYNKATKMAGAVFPGGTRSLLFFGTHGIGPFCYGPAGECNDPAKATKGNHAYPYVHRVWAYDVLDLIAVKNGQKSPWSLLPYEVWSYELPFQLEHRRLSGVAYDPATRRIFISQPFTGGSRLPVIHVFRASGDPAPSGDPTDTSPPAPPTNLTVQ